MLLLVFPFSFVIILLYVTNRTRAQLLQTLVDLSEREQGSQIKNGPGLVGEVAPNFSLQSISGKIFTLKDLLKKPLILLIVDVHCQYCSLDIKEFSEEASLYKDEFNYVLIVNNPINQNLNIEHFEESPFLTLLGSPEFMKDYNIQLFPTFLLVNMQQQIAGLPRFTTDLRGYYG